MIEPLGAILPFGEHKGSGLALVCEILGGALSGGITAHQRSDGQRRVLNGMFSILIDPAKLGTANNLAAEMEEFIHWHTASPPNPQTEKLLIAGQPERISKARRLVEGVPVDAISWKEILAAGEKAGIKSADVERIATA